MIQSVLLIVALLVGAGGISHRAVMPPALSCRVTAAVRLALPNLRAVPIADSTIYEFEGGRLFLIPTDRSRYEYGVLTEQDPLQFTVGAKMISFDGPQYEDATVGHTYPRDVRVLRLRCQRR